MEHPTICSHYTCTFLNTILMFLMIKGFSDLIHIDDFPTLRTYGLFTIFFHIIYPSMHTVFMIYMVNITFQLLNNHIINDFKFTKSTMHIISKNRRKVRLNRFKPVFINFPFKYTRL